MTITVSVAELLKQFGGTAPSWQAGSYVVNVYDPVATELLTVTVSVVVPPGAVALGLKLVEKPDTDEELQLMP